MDYRLEVIRLSTFTSCWPSNAKVDYRKIAKAGFYYSGKDCEAKCGWCGSVISQWDYGDQVMQKHRNANPQCPFITNTSDNVPLNNTSSPSPSISNNPELLHNEESMDITNVVDSPPTDSGGGRLLRPRSFSPERSEMYKRESSRLETYANWPLSYITPAALAKTGFIYTGRDDCVRCVFCGEYVGNWDRSDVPEIEHRDLFPHCPLIRGLEVGNVPLTRHNNTSTDNVSYDRQSSLPAASGSGSDEVGHRDEPTSSRVLKSETGSGGSIGGIMKHNGPAHPKYSTFESRCRTFGDWPPALKQRPNELADAGFYYIGLSDQVKCFSCDGGLRNWQSEDDPWTEHARWFSKCGFVRLVKGDEFILSCLKERPVEALRQEVCVDEERLKSLMSSEIVHQVLSMGIDPSRIKVAIKKKLSDTGSGFETPNQLMDAAFGVQREQEDRVTTENNPSTSAFSRNPTKTPAMTSTDEVNTSSTSSNIESPTSTSTSTPQPQSPQNLNVSEQPPILSKSPVSPPVAMNEETPCIDLETENRRLKEQRTCKICMDNEIGVVFLPCGHLICCVQCTVALKDCPLCRHPIQGTVKTYMS